MSVSEPTEQHLASLRTCDRSPVISCDRKLGIHEQHHHPSGGTPRGDSAGTARPMVMTASPTHFRTSDVDESLAITHDIFWQHSLVPTYDNGQSFVMDLRVGRAGPLAAGLLHYGCEIEAKIDDFGGGYAVALPLGQARFDLSVGSTQFSLDREHAGVFRPQHEVHLHSGWRWGDEVLLLKFDQAALEGELRALVAHDLDQPIELGHGIDLRSDLGRQWVRLSQVVANGLTADSGLAFNPLIAASLSSTLMTGLLLAVEHPHRHLLMKAPGPLPPAMVRRATEIIEERAHEPLTITGIAAEVGCSARALQLGFAKHHGVSPNKYLARVRLERVHRALLASSPDTATVGAIASSWGYTNLGRFAGAYRQRYGVTPLQTLRKH